MKKTILGIVLLVLSTTAAFAIEKEFTVTNSSNNTQNVNQPGQTNFERIGVSGSSTTGNPGLIAMMGCDGGNNCFPYYLWVVNNKLMIASWTTVQSFASFPTGNFNATSFPVGTVVGSQS